MLKPLRSRLSQIIILAVLVSGALLASLLVPSVRAAATPEWASAKFEKPKCGSDFQLEFGNKHDQPARFDVWTPGARLPRASVSVRPQSKATLALTLIDTSQRYIVRVDGVPVADETVNRSTPCYGSRVELPSPAEGVSAKVIAPQCGAEAAVMLNNGNAAPVNFAVDRGTQSNSVVDSVTLDKSMVAAVLLAVPESGQRVTVTGGNNSLATAELSQAQTCSKDSDDTLAESFGPWGRPVRVVEFDSPALDEGPEGWGVYDSPQGEPKRVRESVSLGDSESGTGEARIAGFYDKSQGLHVGGGISDHYNQQYGRWEARVRSDKGAGFAPTILLWPSGHWPNDGEIDLLEAPKADRKKSIAVVHNGAGNTFKTQGLNGDHSEWHVYSVEWLPSRVTFYVDGVEQWNVTDKKLIPSTSPMHMVFQMDEGCGWVQCPNSDTPAETVMHVDWMKVYKASEEIISNG